MKRILLISMVTLILIFAGCTLYEDDTYTIGDMDKSINDAMLNDTSLTIDTLNLVIVESLKKDCDEAYVDVTSDWLDEYYVVESVDTTMNVDPVSGDTSWTYSDVYDTSVDLLDTIGATVLVPKNFQSNKYLLQSSKKRSGYAVLDMTGESTENEVDVYLTDYFAIKIWKTDGTLVEAEEHSIPLELYNFNENVIKEHYLYKLNKEKYVLQFDPAEAVGSDIFQAIVIGN